MMVQYLQRTHSSLGLRFLVAFAVVSLLVLTVSSCLKKKAAKAILASESSVAAQVTFTFHRENTVSPEVEAIYQQIQKAMDEATSYYNAHTRLRKHMNVYYDPGVPTAEGSAGQDPFDVGTIKFGNLWDLRVALHEIGHVMGVGTLWGELSRDGLYHGRRANTLLKTLDGDAAILNADAQHFWPYGLNQGNEDGPEFFVKHCQIVQAIYEDILELRALTNTSPNPQQESQSETSTQPPQNQTELQQTTQQGVQYGPNGYPYCTNGSNTGHGYGWDESVRDPNGKHSCLVP